MSVSVVDVNEKILAQNKLFDISEEKANSLLSLSEYLSIAEKVIGKFAPPGIKREMLNNEDAISFVADHLIKAALRWKEDAGRTLYSYLNQCAIWSIQRWILNKKVANKNNILSLDNIINDEGDNMYNLVANKNHIESNIDEIINKSYLNETQKECLRLRFVDGCTLKEISEKLDKSKQRIDQIINRAISKLREEFVGQA